MTLPDGELLDDAICEHGKAWTQCRKCIEKDYCGCCGNDADDGWWCRRCGGHVRLVGSLETRTYYAQFGKECPYQTPDGLNPTKGQVIQ